MTVRVYLKKVCDTCGKNKGESAYRAYTPSYRKTETSPTCRMCEKHEPKEIAGPTVLELLEKAFLTGVVA